MPGEALQIGGADFGKFLREHLGSLAKSWGKLGPILQTLSADCLGESVGSLFKVLKGCWAHPGGDLRNCLGHCLGKFLKDCGGFGQILWRSWAFALGIPG